MEGTNDNYDPFKYSSDSDANGIWNFDSKIQKISCTEAFISESPSTNRTRVTNLDDVGFFSSALYLCFS